MEQVKLADVLRILTDDALTRQEVTVAVAALPRASGGLEGVDVDALADRVANMRQGESDTPRCEPPGQYEIGISREWVVRVLKALRVRQALAGTKP